MPTRFLSDEQRRRYGRYAGEPADKQLDRYFHLDEADRALITRLRGDHNRLGFAVQLGTVRFLGTFLDDPTDVPSSVLVTMAGQLALGKPPALDGYRHGRQRWRHVALIREHYGYRDFTLDGPARFRLTRWLYALCWAGDDRPSLLIDRATVWLVGNRVLLPGISTIERLVAQIRHRASRRAWRILAAALTQEQQQRIGALLDAERDELTMTLERLRAAPRRRSPTELTRCFERLCAIRAQTLRPTIPEGFPSATLLRLARFGHRVKPAVLAHLPEPRRTATLVALFHTLEATAQDDAVELFEALATEAVGDAAQAHQQARLRTLRDLDSAALKLAQGWRRLLQGTPPPVEWQEHVFDAVPRAEIEAAMEKVEMLVRPDDACHYEELRRRWRRIRRTFAALLDHVSFGASPAAEPVKKALDYLRSLEASWSDAAMRDAPMGAVSGVWRRHVLDARGRVDPRAYVFAILESFRGALKRREIFVTPSIRFADPRRGLLEGAAWAAARVTVCRTLGRSADADAELADLARRLERAYRHVAAHLPSNPHLRFERRRGREELVLTGLDRLPEPESLGRLRAMVGERLPEVDLPDVLLEIAARTGFHDAFTHLGERDAKVDGFTTSLCAVLVAEACNIGLEPLLQPEDPALRRARLSWVAQNFVRDETIAAANARLVAAQNMLPIARLWGDGEIASADGVRFVVPSRAVHAGPNPRYFGIGRGITYYNLMSDQFTGLNAVVVPGTLKDSLVILGLLLGQETELEPAEIMADTGAYTDCIFGLFWLLGYQFSPRLADVGGARFWRIASGADYGQLNVLARHRVDTGLVARHWEDLLRLAGSLKLGHVHPYAAMRMLQVKDRRTALARALGELGRVIKTLHLLGYIDDEGKRRAILTQLNRHEARHRLIRVVCHGKRGEIRKPHRQGQEEQLGVLGLVLNAIVLWNAIYIGAVVERIRAEGIEVDPQDVARLSPLMHKHINFLGRYAFSLPEPIANGQLRQLRAPPFAPDFRTAL
jgi:TnpA family transposase